MKLSIDILFYLIKFVFYTVHRLTNLFFHILNLYIALRIYNFFYLSDVLVNLVLIYAEQRFKLNFKTGHLLNQNQFLLLQVLVIVLSHTKSTLNLFLTLEVKNQFISCSPNSKALGLLATIQSKIQSYFLNVSFDNWDAGFIIILYYSCTGRAFKD